MHILKSIYRAVFPKDTGGHWREFAKKRTAVYKNRFGEHVVAMSYRGQLLELAAYTDYSTAGGSTYESCYTSGQVNFVPATDFKLCIVEEGFFEWIAKLFGSQDIEINNAEFDRQFMLKSNDPEQTRKIFADVELLRLIQKNELIRLEITKDDGLFQERPPKGQHMIYLITNREMKTEIELERMMKLLFRLIDRLIENRLIHASEITSAESI